MSSSEKILSRALAVVVTALLAGPAFLDGQLASTSRFDPNVSYGDTRPSVAGSISGTVKDEDGRPLSCSIMALFPPGRETRPVPWPTEVTTDTDGRYRLDGLSPGLFMIVATPLQTRPPNRQGMLVPTLYPRAMTVSDAHTVLLPPAGALSGVDITVQRSLSTRLDLTLTTPAGENAELALVMTASAVPGDLASTKSAYAARERGINRVQRVPVLAGRRLILARAAQEVEDGSETVFWARGAVDVDGSAPVKVSLALRPAATVSGRLWFDWERPPSESPRIRLRPAADLAAGGGPPLVTEATVDASGRFVIKGVAPGRYVLDVLPRNHPNWTVTGFSVPGAELLDVPFELGSGQILDEAILTIRRQQTELTGTLRGDDGARADTMLLIFSTDPRHWWQGTPRVRAIRTDESGRFETRGLPAGHYQVAVMTEPVRGVLGDPVLLSRLMGAGVPLLLTIGETVSLNLRVPHRGPVDETGHLASVSADDEGIYRAVLEHTILPEARRLNPHARPFAPLWMLDVTLPVCPASDQRQRLEQCAERHIADALDIGVELTGFLAFEGVLSGAVRVQLGKSFRVRNARSHPFLRLDSPDLGYVSIEDVYGPREHAYEKIDTRSGQNIGLAGFSRPAYSDDGQAVVYAIYRCGGMCGSGWQLLLQKEDGVWLVREVETVWVS